MWRWKQRSKGCECWKGPGAKEPKRQGIQAGKGKESDSPLEPPEGEVKLLSQDHITIGMVAEVTSKPVLFLLSASCLPRTCQLFMENQERY